MLALLLALFFLAFIAGLMSVAWWGLRPLALGAFTVAAVVGIIAITVSLIGRARNRIHDRRTHGRSNTRENAGESTA